jgi:4a-hydroxytetrahydrobiopterin dehydratase
MKLDSKALIPCTRSSSALSDDEINRFLKELSNWRLLPESSVQKISKHFTFKNYLTAVEFANRVASLAEQENHHPRICIEWGKATIDWWTHSINGLFINDFIMAARCDSIFSELK